MFVGMVFLRSPAISSDLQRSLRKGLAISSDLQRSYRPIAEESSAKAFRALEIEKLFSKKRSQKLLSRLFFRR